MSSDVLRFHGLEFFSGYEFLPKDIPLDLQNLRQWAFEQGLVFEPESQFLNEERLQELVRYFSSDDGLLIAIAIEGSSDESIYMEYPYLPVKSLIRRAEEVEIVYWRMVPVRWNADGKVLLYGEVRFGFWYSGCGEELCSISTAKRVTTKFDALLSRLSCTYDIVSFKDRSKEVTVDGAVRAKFFREGRFFDVSFSMEGK